MSAYAYGLIAGLVVASLCMAGIFWWLGPQGKPEGEQ